MSKDIVKDSIKCLANMEIKETTYQVARDIVLEEIEKLNNKIETLKAINHLFINQKNKLEYKLDMLDGRIDKAIEQLEELKNLYNDNYTISDKASDILEILRGEE